MTTITPSPAQATHEREQERQWECEEARWLEELLPLTGTPLVIIEGGSGRRGPAMGESKAHLRIVR